MARIRDPGKASVNLRTIAAEIDVFPTPPLPESAKITPSMILIISGVFRDVKLKMMPRRGGIDKDKDGGYEYCTYRIKQKC
jgi:hypothetical protein